MTPAVSDEPDRELVRRAIEGQAAARHALVLRSSPVVQRRVCRPLASSRVGPWSALFVITEQGRAPLA